MLNESVHVRYLKDSDNLKDVSKLIFETDVIIYPELLKNKEIAQIVLPEIIKGNQSFMCFENILVAEIDHQIVGILIIMNNDKSWNQCDVESIFIEKSLDIPKGFDYVNKMYFDALHDYCSDDCGYISNICVSEDYQKKGVGHALLKYVTNTYKKELALHVLVDNSNAIRLYKNFDFKVIETCPGFSSKEGTDTSCYYMLKQL